MTIGGVPVSGTKGARTARTLRHLAVARMPLCACWRILDRRTVPCDPTVCLSRPAQPRPGRQREGSAPVDYPPQEGWTGLRYRHEKLPR